MFWETSVLALHHIRIVNEREKINVINYFFNEIKIILKKIIVAPIGIRTRPYRLEFKLCYLYTIDAKLEIYD